MSPDGPGPPPARALTSRRGDDRDRGSTKSPGTEPWDPATGLRVGTMVGGLVGAAIMALTGIANFWIIVGSGVAGGAIGFWSERRKQRGHGRR